MHSALIGMSVCDAWMVFKHAIFLKSERRSQFAGDGKYAMQPTLIKFRSATNYERIMRDNLLVLCVCAEGFIKVLICANVNEQN